MGDYYGPDNILVWMAEWIKAEVGRNLRGKDLVYRAVPNYKPASDHLALRMEMQLTE